MQFLFALMIDLFTLLEELLFLWCKWGSDIVIDLEIE